jgi:hypothetical protein
MDLPIYGVEIMLFPLKLSFKGLNQVAGIVGLTEKAKSTVAFNFILHNYETLYILQISSSNWQKAE